MRITDKITITNEDNMELMSRYPDNYFDLAIVDLEFGIGASKPSKKPNKAKQKNGTTLKIKPSNYKPKDWDFQLSSPDYLQELFRVSKKQMIKGGNYYGLTGGYLVWDKLNGKSDQFGCELIWLSWTKRTDIVYYLWSGMFQGENVSKDPRKALIQIGNKKDNEKRIHPTQTPVKLYDWILNNYATKGDKILDTHLGSGSLAIACHNNGFELTACEIDEDYYSDTISRVNNRVKSKTLLDLIEDTKKLNST